MQRLKMKITNRRYTIIRMQDNFTIISVETKCTRYAYRKEEYNSHNDAFLEQWTIKCECLVLSTFATNMTSIFGILNEENKLQKFNELKVNITFVILV